MAKKVVAFLFVAGVLASIWLGRYAVRPGGRGPAGTEAVVTIPAGTGLQGIRARLAAAGAIDDDLRFVLLARLLDVSRRLQAGEYRFPAGATPLEILRMLEEGRIVRWPVTIPEGANLAEIADILARGQWVERERFLALARDPAFIRTLGVEAASLEGYLFPETYYLSRGQGAEEILRIMVAQLRAVVAELCPESEIGSQESEARIQESEFRSQKSEHRTQKTEPEPPHAPTHPRTHSPTDSPASQPVSDRTQNTEHGTQPSALGARIVCGTTPPLTFHELLTLASIVEKETGCAGERPLIACVFLNRLQKGMRLQADPTVIYGIPDFDGNLTRRHLRADNPYNTYRVKGLPPTPIASPGRAAIEAVLHPAPASYLYFVSRNDGTHQFSSTLSEHNKAVARYQKGTRRAAEKSR